MLSLGHNKKCQAVDYPGSLIRSSSIERHKSLKKKFSPGFDKESKFYGCYTANFASQWHNIYNVNSSGAENKIDFGVLNRDSNITDITERIEKTFTSEGSPKWTRFK